jgi:hypothetical protein
MTIAEIHGKLSAYEHMEDLLTSDVFSTFKYLKVNDGLIPFLTKAISFKHNKHPNFLTEIKSADYVFWPRTTYLNREPDVLIILTKIDGSTISILIEAKYMSGKSNLNRDEESLDKENNRLKHLDGDQLAELYMELQEGNIHIPDKSLREKFKKSEGNRFVFFVTAHYSFPRKDIEETFDVFKKKQYGNHNSLDIFWINWMSIIDVIEEVKSRIDFKNASTTSLLLSDLNDLLYKKELVPFHGFSKLQINFPKQNIFYFDESTIFEKLCFEEIDISKISKNKNYFWEGD